MLLPLITRLDAAEIRSRRMMARSNPISSWESFIPSLIRGVSQILILAVLEMIVKTRPVKLRSEYPDLSNPEISSGLGHQCHLGDLIFP